MQAAVGQCKLSFPPLLPPRSPSLLPPSPFLSSLPPPPRSPPINGISWLQSAAGDRKSFIRTKELQRRKNEKLTDVEEVARDRALYLLEKANTMRLEQEDEIKQINEIITGARCHAIRDAQILEKEQIERELVEEEKRLDKMMEVDRQKAIKLQDEIESIRKQNGLRARAHIIEQI
uniref:cilia- and flagella-associated protein 45-like n=1 Tax=Pristiophorus japonicus TaxID=55135 RepID=UPI00398F41A7